MENKRGEARGGVVNKSGFDLCPPPLTSSAFIHSKERRGEERRGEERRGEERRRMITPSAAISLNLLAGGSRFHQLQY